MIAACRTPLSARGYTCKLGRKVDRNLMCSEPVIRQFVKPLVGVDAGNFSRRSERVLKNLKLADGIALLIPGCGTARRLGAFCARVDSSTRKIGLLVSPDLGSPRQSHRKQRGDCDRPPRARDHRGPNLHFDHLQPTLVSYPIFRDDPAAQ